MKAGHERNQESLNWLFNSKQSIKSGYNTKVDRLIDEMYEQHFITEEDLNVAKQKKYTDEEINQLEKNYVDFRNTNSWDDMKRIIKETVGIIKSSRRPIKSAVGEEVTISLETLYEKIGRDAKYGIIQYSENGDSDWYDFYNEFDEMACCDGETCKIVDETEDYVELRSEDDPNGAIFKLSKEEFDECSWGIMSSRRPIKSGWTFIFGTDKAAVYENDNGDTYKVECRNGSNFIDEYFDDEQDARDFAIEISE